MPAPQENLIMTVKKFVELRDILNKDQLFGHRFLLTDTRPLPEEAK